MRFCGHVQHGRVPSRHPSLGSVSSRGKVVVHVFCAQKEIPFLAMMRRGIGRMQFRGAVLGSETHGVDMGNTTMFNFCIVRLGLGCFAFAAPGASCGLCMRMILAFIGTRSTNLKHFALSSQPGVQALRLGLGAEATS